MQKIKQYMEAMIWNWNTNKLISVEHQFMRQMPAGSL